MPLQGSLAELSYQGASEYAESILLPPGVCGFNFTLNRLRPKGGQTLVHMALTIHGGRKAWY